MVKFKGKALLCDTVQLRCYEFIALSVQYYFFYWLVMLHFLLYFKAN